MMENEITHYEELLLKSWDAALTGEERNSLSAEMQRDASLRRQSEHYLRIRDMLHRTEPDTFGPFFGERILNVIKNRAENLEYLIFFFFKKYQALVVGVFVALLVTNLLLSDNLTLKAVFGLEQQTSEDVFSINLYKDLTQ